MIAHDMRRRLETMPATAEQAEALARWQAAQAGTEEDKAEAAAELRRRRDRFEAEAERKRAADREAAQRARREGEAAAKRAAVERDLRLDGVAEAGIAAAADRVMATWRERRALEAAEAGDRATWELHDYFRSRPAPALPE